ncbi:DUF748 domain-containing protein [Pseudothauera nasutitermitis]|uniref:DUF748 domain-containing protein n=1 Tax=Pseudothauera nasutitermitis TaxID=2565930 RepID=A0A4S4B3K0_9RHOO|nr:DUF748 domain-containing protein [Pseudothauera nasutitermitis]THF66310.1 DUF748 domain-containing protein [Pseudothauera nasutitermitis]
MLSPAALAARLRPSRKLLNWSAALAATYALFGFLVLPMLARHYGEEQMRALSGREVTVDAVRFNPFTLALTVEGLHVPEATDGETAFALERLYANLEIESLLRRGPVLHELRVVAPQLRVVREEGGRYNWSDVFDRVAELSAGKEEDEEEGGEARFSLGNIQVQGGGVVFDDRVAGVRHDFAEINLGLPFLSNLPVRVDTFVEPVLSAKVNGHPLELKGRSKPFTEQRETSFNIALDQLEIAPYLAYLPFEPAFALRSGTLSTGVDVSFSQPPGVVPRIVLNGEVSLAGVRVDDLQAGSQVVAFEEFAVEMADLQPLAGKWHFTRLRLHAPEVDLVRLRDGSLNLAHLLPATQEKAANGKARGGNGKSANGKAKPAAAESTPASTADFLLSTARVRDGVLRFEDRSTPAPFKTELQAINLDLRDLANAGDLIAEIRADFHTDAEERFEFQQQLRMAPVELEGTVSVEGLRPARFAPYYQGALGAGELRDGRVDGVVRHRLRMAGEQTDVAVTVENLAAHELALGLKGRAQPLAQLAELKIAAAEVLPGERSVKVGEVAVDGLRVALQRNAQGRLDALALMPPSSGAQDAGKPWSFLLEQLRVGNSGVRLEDRSAGRLVVLDADQIAFSAEGLGNARGSNAKVDLRARINQRGRVGVNGSLGLEPLRADLTLDLRSVDLLPLQPYVLEQTNIAISRGNLTTAGRLSLEQARDGAWKGRFRGDLGVANFASVDRANATDFVRWRTLRVAGANVALEPLSVAVREIALTDFQTRLILDENGRLNLRDLGAQGEGDEARDEEIVAVEEGTLRQAPTPVAEVEVSPPAPLPPISIGRVLLKQGNIEFSDRFIRPNYDANLTGMEGELRGLSSDPSTVATLELAGTVDNSAPVNISGELNPFRQDRHLDIAASVKDFELTGVSAYSGKYVGYGIEKGKLSAELSYKIEDRRLSATNRIFLDQLTFGPRTDSPDAIKAPVQLAVALLQNRRGEIDIHLPVSGTLDDPQFSIGGLVFRAIMNLLGRAITAPFALLGSAFGGGGEELSNLPYAAGRATLDEAAVERAKALAEALADRPSLRLEIIGVADPDSDPDGLRREKMLRQVKAVKLKESIRRNEEAPSLDDIDVGADEYPELLRRVYRDGDFPKERNLIGMVRDVPVEQMEEAILTHMEISADELNTLAQQRAQAARTWLVEQGGVAAERVFVLAPRVGPKEGDDCTGCARFSLR